MANIYVCDYGATFCFDGRPHRAKGVVTFTLSEGEIPKSSASGSRTAYSELSPISGKLTVDAGLNKEIVQKLINWLSPVREFLVMGVFKKEPAGSLNAWTIKATSIFGSYTTSSYGIFVEGSLQLHPTDGLDLSQCPQGKEDTHMIEYERRPTIVAREIANMNDVQIRVLGGIVKYNGICLDPNRNSEEEFAAMSYIYNLGWVNLDMAKPHPDGRMLVECRPKDAWRAAMVKAYIQNVGMPTATFEAALW